MAQPVWVLSVDLQAKTATFASGMGEAARSARGAFDEIKSGAADTGKETGYSMSEARHGVMLLGEEFGVHLPRALTTFISSLGPIGAAMEAAFPFLAILVGATLLLEHLAKMREEGEKLTQSQVQFGTTTANVLNGLNDKLLQAGIKADELRGDHLAALEKQLELIDHQSMQELVKSFETIAKAADSTFKLLETKWYQFGEGSAGAKASLERFKTEYESLMSQGKDGEQQAAALLDAKVAREQHILDLQKQQRDNQVVTGTGGTHGNYAKAEEAANALRAIGVGWTEKEIEAQQTLVGVLQGTVNAQQTINQIKALEKDNATQSAQDKITGDQEKVLRAQAQEERRAVEESEKLWQEHYREAVSQLEESEKEKIAATQKGSQARLDAIDAAIKTEQAKGLQDTGFYKGLLTQRVETARQMLEEENRIKEQLGKESAAHDEKTAELGIAAEKTAAELRLSTMANTERAKVAYAIQFANEEYQAKKDELYKEIAALDKSGKDYEVKLRTLQDREKEMVQQHENEITAIRTKAEADRNKRLTAGLTQLEQQTARAFAQSVVEGKNFGQSMAQIGAQVLEQMIQNSLMAMAMRDAEKPSEAASAARKVFDSVAGIPYVGPFLAPEAAAAAFAAVMAFQEGGIVPGVGRGDVVPAMLEPGEAVLPKQLTESLTNMAANGGGGSRGDVHVHHHATYNVQAFDSDGVNKVLQKHGDAFTQHAVSTLRRMNIG